MLQDEVMEQAFVTLNIDCSTQSPGEKPLILTWERSPGWDEEPVHVSICLIFWCWPYEGLEYHL